MKLTTAQSKTLVLALVRNELWNDAKASFKRRRKPFTKADQKWVQERIDRLCPLHGKPLPPKPTPPPRTSAVPDRIPGGFF